MNKGKDRGSCGLEQRLWILSMLESQQKVLRKGREAANTWFTYIFLWLCETCFVKRRGVYGLTRVKIVETERNEQIWDVLELGQYMSKLKDLKMQG